MLPGSSSFEPVIDGKSDRGVDGEKLKVTEVAAVFVPKGTT